MSKSTQEDEQNQPSAKESRPSGRSGRRRCSKRAASTREKSSAERRPAPSAALAPESNGFAELGLSSETLSSLNDAGFFQPTDIQRELIPCALQGRDCLGQARTGTGKTAAFTLPILERVESGAGIQAVVLVPTRELAAQVGEHVRMLSPRHPLQTLTVYGGTKINSDLKRLGQPIDILVGTPGRILDLIKRRALSLADVRIAVLDEVDRMLDIGFRDDIRRIMSHVKPSRQTLFVSATITDEIRRLARALMRDPVEINVSADRLTVDSVEQHYVSVDTREKFQVLQRFLKHKKPKLAIVFTRTKRGASNVAKKLKQSGVSCAEIHGDLRQVRRTRVLGDLRRGRLQVLVATDLASRGLDVMEISHIVNYDIPEDPAVYVHRIGRTARMGHQGEAITFVTAEQGAELTEIEKLINRELNRVNAADFTPTSHVPPALMPHVPPAPAGAPPHGGRAHPAASHAIAPQTAEPHPASTHVPTTPEAPGPKKLPRTLGGRFPTRRRRR